MKEENAIEVKNVKKSFRIYYDKGNTLKEKLLFSKRRKYEQRVVLNGISFEVKKGEAIGLIGHNGCGKSTTLKLLTKIMYPDSGTIEMRGRVSSLIELGAGFHPDMSGRENIYINASIFGLTKKEIDQRLDKIIEFSELEKYIDDPVRTYSSGMYMRLAFSVAINVDADILLIDEILAVGDVAFQTKCFNKLREIKANKTTIVIVSHTLAQLEMFCDKNIWIDKGVVCLEGAPKYVDLKYTDFVMNTEKEKTREKKEKQEEKKKQEEKELGNKEVEILEAKIINGNVFKIGDTIKIEVTYKRNDRDLKDAVLGINLMRNDGTYCYGTSTLLDKCNSWELLDDGKIEITLYNVMLLQGEYNMDIAFADGGATNYHYIRQAVKFQIVNEFAELGICRVEHTWKCV